MKFKARKILAAILSAAVSVTLLSACKKDEDVTNANTVSRIVYRAKSQIVSGAADDTDGYVLRDGRLYFRGSKSESYSENGGYYEKVFYSLNSVNLDGTDLQTVPVSEGGTAVSNFDFDGEGNVVFIETIPPENGEETEYNYTLKKNKTDGMPISEIDITDILNEHAVEYFSPESVAVDVSRNIVINGYFQIIILDGEGNFLFDIKFDEGIRKLVKTSTGGVCVSAYGAESYSEFYKINMSEKSVGDNIDIVQGYDFDYNIVPYQGYGNGENIYVADGDNLYFFDLENGVKTEVFNYVNSDIISQEISEIIPADEGKFIGVGRSYPAKNLQIMEIYPVDASALPEKTEIIVAGSDYSVNSMVEYQAVKFNMSNEKYKISIKKYSGEDSITRLNADIAAGKIPDILLTDSSMPFESYAAKGLFADLYEFIDNDGEMSREDFLPNLLSAMETDGKLYRFTDSFMIFTAVGKTSIFGENAGIDFDKINDIISEYPEGTEIFAGTTKEDILQHAMELCADEFIDYKAGKCDFTSEYFIGLLEFANNFLNSIDLDSYFNDGFWGRYETMYADDEALLLIVYVTDFSDIFYNERQLFGEEVTAVGFPTLNGTGAAFDVSGGFSVSAKSKNQEGAWEFLRTLLTEDYQDGVEQLPVRNSSLNKKAEKDMKEFDPNATRITTIGSMSIGTSGYMIEGTPTRADIDKTMEIINSTAQICRNNYTISAIITEEAGAYFSGSKTAEAVAEMIQNRVQNYLDENQ